MTETTAGHRFSEGRARFNRVANVLLLVCGLNAAAYVYFLNDAIASGERVSILESYEPNVLSFKGEHARVAPEVHRRMETYGYVTGVLGLMALALKFLLIAVNARLPASEPPDLRDELGPIRIASDGVAHSGGSQWPIVLPRSEVEHLELTYMPVADKPLGLRVCGVVFLLMGLPLAVLLLPKIGDHGSILAAFCLFAGVAGIGVWMISITIRKRFVLVAHTPNGSSSMVFHRSARRKDVIHFATSAARRHGYPFDFGQGLVG